MGKGPVSYSGQTLTNQNFSGLPSGRLKGADFSNAILIGVNFSNADLTDANFSGAKFQENAQGIRTNLSNATLTNACFTGANLNGADMQFSNFNQTDFSCADLSSTSFGPIITIAGNKSKRTKFNHAKLSIAVNDDSLLFPLENMSQSVSDFWGLVDFSCTRLIGLSQSNFATQGLNLSNAKLAGQQFAGYVFYDKDNHQNCNLSGADLTGTDLSNAKLQYCNLDGVTLSDAKLEGTDFTEANFYTENNAADLTNAILTGTTLNNATLSHADLAGAQLVNVQAFGQDTDFSNVNMQATATNNGGRVGVTTITNSTFDHADFSNAQLNDVTFRDSSLNNVNFSSLTLSGTDFGNSQLVGTNFENTKLQNVKFDSSYINNASFKSSTLKSLENGAGVDFTCSQLGGSDFSNTTVDSANFTGAVMPQATDNCCSIEGGGYNCGTAVNGVIYGATTVPIIPAGIEIDCPNGDITNCRADDWKIPNWKTASCDSGESLWAPPTCGKQPASITINDPNLKSCLQGILFNGALEEITIKAAKNLQYLVCPSMGISDITVLGQEDSKTHELYFPNLISIDLSANSLTGSGDFSSFTSQLKSVKVSYNQLTSLTFSSQQTSLNTLEAANNKLSSVDISADIYLSYLDLSNNQLTGDFSQSYTFSGVTNINYIDLSGNQLTNVFAEFNTTNTPALNTLSLHNNNLTTIGSLKELWNHDQGNLYSVSLGNNACFECNTLCVSSGTVEAFQCSCNESTCGESCNQECPVK